MITSVEIKNFKSIKALSVDLPKFSVLVGPNGSGKTNIVQALELFGEILQRGTTDPVRDRGWEQLIRRAKRPARGGITLGVDVSHIISIPALRSPGTPEDAGRTFDLSIVTLSARITLTGLDGGRDVAVEREELVARSPAGELSIVADRSGWTIDVGSDPALWSLFPLNVGGTSGPAMGVDQRSRSLEQTFGSVFRTADGSDQGVLQLFNRARFPLPWLSSLLQSCRIHRIRLDTSALRDDSPTRDARSTVLGSAGEGLAAAVDRLRGSGKESSAAFRRVLSALQKVYPRIEDIRAHRIQPGRLTLLFKERGIEQDLGQSNVSDGVLRALALLVMLEGDKHRARGGLLAIEEPENALHPWSLQLMIERAQASAQQVLITTHSETVVDAIKDPASLLIVENDDPNGTIVALAHDRESALDTILAESGQKLGDVWLGGALGGVPGPL